MQSPLCRKYLLNKISTDGLYTVYRSKIVKKEEYRWHIAIVWARRSDLLILLTFGDVQKPKSVRMVVMCSCAGYAF